MRIFVCISVFLAVFLVNGQNVFEYNITNNLIFKVYGEDEGKMYKISKEKDFKQNTPEAVALSSFFAYSNDIASKLYFNQESYYEKDEEDFEGIKQTRDEDAYIQLLHKTNYRLEGNDLCYVMFIAKIKDVDFPFPTLLPLMKKDSKWYIYTRPNQEKLTTTLKMLKPCVLSNLIEGNSRDIDVRNLISKTKSNIEGIDFNKLFDELTIIKSNKPLFNKLTLAQDANCSDFDYKNNVQSVNTITDILNNVSIRKIKKQDPSLVSQIKKESDSIVLTNKLEFDYLGKKYNVIKYNEINSNGTKVKKNYKTFNLELNSPLKELVLLYERLNPQLFSILSPSLKEKPIHKTPLFKQTRGVYDILNITKLYNLFEKNDTLFEAYLYK